jgi:predicted DNA-binding helix-hairpin-helix protein
VLLCGLNDLRITLLNLACIYICVHCLFSESYTTEALVFLIEAVDSHFHLYRRDFHHNRIDGASLDAGTCDAENDSVSNYFECYDESLWLKL